MNGLGIYRLNHLNASPKSLSLLRTSSSSSSFTTLYSTTNMNSVDDRHWRDTFVMNGEL